MPSTTASKMKSLYSTVLLVTCTSVFYAEGVDNKERQEETINLGLYFVYDEAFSQRAGFKDDDGTFNTYFTVFTNAVEAYFRNHPTLKIYLTLVGSSKLEEQYIIENTTLTSRTQINAEETLRKLELVMTWNDTLPREADILFLATGLQLQTRESYMTGEWYGLAYPRSICYGNVTTGIVHDDGLTFKGVHLAALQVAIMLGAKKDNGRWGECGLTEDNYLVSSINGGRPYLSECSQGSMRDFYWRVNNREDVCWNDVPKPVVENNTDLPVKFYKKYDCDVCHVTEYIKNGTTGSLNCSLSTINRNISPWPTTRATAWNYAARRRFRRQYARRTTTRSPYQDCVQSCCRFIRRYPGDPDRLGGYYDCFSTIAADGTVCDSERVCLHGVCA